MNVRTLIGEPVHRAEDFRFLRGAGSFIDDIEREGMLHAVVLRSPVAHGRIRRIDTAAARAMPGVHAVMTAADIGKVPSIPLRLANLPELTADLVAGRPGCKPVRCAATGVGSDAIAFELVYDDKALDNNRVAENRSTILLALVESLRPPKVRIIRASDITPPLAPF